MTIKTGPEHYRHKAERLAAMAHHYTYGDGADSAAGAALAAESQAYALLAAAATMQTLVQNKNECGSGCERHGAAPQPQGFFQAGSDYRRGRWNFRCLAVAPSPYDGEVRAIGFLYRDGEPATATALGSADWALAEWTQQGAGWMSTRDELPAAPRVIYRAQHESVAMGLYTTAAEARAHCVAEQRRWGGSSETSALDWIEDEEDGIAELVTMATHGESETPTGYVVTALEIASKYDEHRENQ